MGPDRGAQGQGRDRLTASPPELRALCAAALSRDPGRAAIEFEGLWHSWGELRAVADGVTGALAASGAADDAPVVFVPRNTPEAVATLLALLSQGRTVRMVYAFQAPAALARDVAALEGCAVIAAERDFAPEVREALRTKGSAGIAIDASGAKLLPGLERAAAVAADGAPQIEILTSGTTGPPKRFAVPYALLERHFISTPLTASQGGDPENLPPFLLSYPLGNITGLYTTLPTALRGQRIILLDRFDLAAWLDYVRRWRPGHSGLPPSCVQQVLDLRVPREDLSSLRALGIGAAPLDPTVQAAFEDAYDIPILVSYGATEFAGPVASMSIEAHREFGRAKLGTVGRALPGVKLRVVDAESGEPLPHGDEGLLEVVAPRIGPEWIRTADLAVLDADGFLFIRGRADGAIMRGGFKVLPESVERALMLHPAVAEAAVTGIPDRRLGQVPAAAIRLKPGHPEPTPAELESHLRSLLLATQIPARWLICNDFPRTGSHKTDRVALRSLFVSK